MASELHQGIDQIDIRVWHAAVFRNSIQDLQNMSIAQINGVQVPLSAVSSMVIGRGPNEIWRINIMNFSSNDIPVVQARIPAPGVDLAANYDLLEKHVKVPIQRIPGVAKVDLDGVLPKAVYVDLILDKLREHNGDVGSLIDRLQKNNTNVSIGKVRNEDRVITVRALGSFPDLNAIKNMPINEQGLRLQDIAEVKYEEPAIEYGRHLNHSYAVAIQVYKEPMANTVEVATQVVHLIKNVFPNDPYLRGVSLFIWEDQAAEIKNGLGGITSGGLWGGLFAILILFVFLRRIDMILGLRVEDRENIEDLKNLRIGTPSGPIQLRSIVDFKTVERQNQIQRQNRKNFLSLRAVYEGKDWGKARGELAAIMDSINYPPGYSWSFDRQVTRDDEDNRIMLINFALALALVHIFMAALFESLIHPLAIIVSIPFALIGVLWFLLVTGAPFNLMAQIGLLILMGVVVRNGIVLVARVHQLREHGMQREQALLQAGDDHRGVEGPAPRFCPGSRRKTSGDESPPPDAALPDVRHRRHRRSRLRRPDGRAATPDPTPTASEALHAVVPGRSLPTHFRAILDIAHARRCLQCEFRTPIGPIRVTWPRRRWSSEPYYRSSNSGLGREKQIPMTHGLVQITKGRQPGFSSGPAASNTRRVKRQAGPRQMLSPD